MSNDNNYNGFEEQRRRKAENFKLNIRDNYDDNGSSYSAEAEPEEISSYSGEEVKYQIERESKKSLKKRKKEEKKELKARNRRNRRIFRITWIVSVLIVGAMVAVYFITGMNDLLAINRKDDSAVTVQVPKDADINTVTTALKNSGVIAEPNYFKLYATITKNDTFSQGTYELKKNMDYQAIITNLQGTSNRTDTIEVTIIEGQNVLEIADKLEAEGALGDKAKFLELCNSNEFDDDYDFIKSIQNTKERYYKLEGYLYPDKYEFYVNEDPASIIYKILNNYEKRIYEKQAFNGYEKLYSVNKMLEKTESEYNLDEIMTIASIIQAEAADSEDMYYISSILHNRLNADSDMGVNSLGLDSTKYYPYRSEDKLPANVGSNFKSRYNTYDNEGLPPGPICNPGMEAIKAAICPNDTSYFYFCHDSSGRAYYASTIYEHEANLEYIE